MGNLHTRRKEDRLSPLLHSRGHEARRLLSSAEDTSDSSDSLRENLIHIKSTLSSRATSAVPPTPEETTDHVSEKADEEKLDPLNKFQQQEDEFYIPVWDYADGIIKKDVTTLVDKDVNKDDVRQMVEELCEALQSLPPHLHTTKVRLRLEVSPHRKPHPVPGLPHLAKSPIWEGKAPEDRPRRLLPQTKQEDFDKRKYYYQFFKKKPNESPYTANLQDLQSKDHPGRGSRHHHNNKHHSERHHWGDNAQKNLLPVEMPRLKHPSHKNGAQPSYDLYDYVYTSPLTPRRTKPKQRERERKKSMQQVNAWLDQEHKKQERVVHHYHHHEHVHHHYHHYVAD